MTDQFTDILALPGRFLEFLLEPPRFLYILGGVFLASVLSLMYSEFCQTRQLKAKDAQLIRFRDEIVRLEKELEIAKRMNEELRGRDSGLGQKSSATG